MSDQAPKPENEATANVHDVVAYIIEQHGGSIGAMKMQKLLYYCQAWSLVWNDRPMFKDRIEAWTHGPIVPSVWKHHRGEFTLRCWLRGKSDRLPLLDREAADTIMEHYGPLSGVQLSSLTHRENPWQDARVGVGVDEPCREEITKESMKKFYTDLLNSDTAQIVSEVDWPA